MNCMLYLKMERFTELLSIGYLELAVHFRSNCFPNTLTKVFIAESQRALPRVINFKIRGISVLIRTGKSDRAGTAKQPSRSWREYRVQHLFYQRRHLVNKPDTLFGESIAYGSKSDRRKGKKVELPFVQFNSTYVIVPKNHRTAFWTYEEVDSIWEDRNPHECSVRQGKSDEKLKQLADPSSEEGSEDHDKRAEQRIQRAEPAEKKKKPKRV